MGDTTGLDAAENATNLSGAVPAFWKRRGKRHWAIARPLMKDFAAVAGTGAVLGWLMTLTNSDFGLALFFGMLVGFKSLSRSIWAIMRALAVLPMRKRDVMFSALAVSLLFAYAPLLSGAGVLYLMQAVTAHPAPPPLAYFFAVQPLFLSLVFLFTGASTGTDCVTMGESMSVVIGACLVALTLVSLAVTPELFYSLGDRVVVFLVGMLVLPPSLMLSLRLLKRSLDDNAFYRKVPAE